MGDRDRFQPYQVRGRGRGGISGGPHRGGFRDFGHGGDRQEFGGARYSGAMPSAHGKHRVFLLALVWVIGLGLLEWQRESV